MRIDEQVIHTDDIGGVVGEFHGTPIHVVNTFDVDLREIMDAQARARVSLGIESPEIALLPGEVIKDHIIRRATTAEVIGEAFYAGKPQVSFEESISGLQDPSYYDAKEGGPDGNRTT
jgi:hypothetical protein